MRFRQWARLTCMAWAVGGLSTDSLSAQVVTFPPYIQVGDNGSFGPRDQIDRHVADR